MTNKNIRTKEDFYRENYKADSTVNPHTIDNFKFSDLVNKFIKQVNLKESQINSYRRLKINLELAQKDLNLDPSNKVLKATYHKAYNEVMQFEVETGIMTLAKAFCKEQAKKHRFNIKIN